MKIIGGKSDAYYDKLADDLAVYNKNSTPSKFSEFLFYGIISTMLLFIVTLFIVIPFTGK